MFRYLYFYFYKNKNKKNKNKKGFTPLGFYVVLKQPFL
jgi:hypothetical protein